MVWWHKTPFKHSKMDCVEIGTENKDLVPCFIIHSIDHRYYMVPTKAVLSIWEAVANIAAKTHTRWTWGCLSRIPSTWEVEVGDPEVQGQPWLYSKLKDSYMRICLRRAKRSIAQFLDALWNPPRRLQIWTKANTKIRLGRGKWGQKEKKMILGTSLLVNFV